MSRRAPSRMTLEAMIQMVGCAVGVSPEQIRSCCRQRHALDARRSVWARLLRQGYTPSGINDAWGGGALYAIREMIMNRRPRAGVVTEVYRRSEGN